MTPPVSPVLGRHYVAIVPLLRSTIRNDTWYMNFCEKHWDETDDA